MLRTTDNANIVAPLNAQQAVTFLPFNDEEALEKELKKGDVCAVIFEGIQGVGGLDEPSESFVYALERLCNTYNSCLIADEVQAGFGRTGTFFSYQQYNIQPHIVTMAKGMGNGFPIGGILIHPSIEAKYGLLGTTFGGITLPVSLLWLYSKCLKPIILKPTPKPWETILLKKPKNPGGKASKRTRTHVGNGIRF